VSLNTPLLNALRALRDACACQDDATDTLKVSGHGNALEALSGVIALLAESNVHPRLSVDGAAVVLEEVAPSDSWELNVAKRPLAVALGYTCEHSETLVMFFSAAAFNSWATRQTALKDGFRWPDRLTIVVDGIVGALAGPQLRCGSFAVPLPDFDTDKPAIAPQHVTPLVQLAPESTTRMIGQTFLTRGDLGSTSFSALRRWAERDAAQLLCSEVTFRDGTFCAQLKGGRRVGLLLDDPSAPPELADLELVQQAASWCFAENRDARHALLVDRLALDAEEGKSFILFLRDHLQSAMQDARDQYRMVVLEKKDAAAKETREVLKEVRTQADLYASKVRDLVATFLRDLLATLLLVGLGLLGRINSDTLKSVLTSEPVDVFFRVLAGYFLLSTAFQVATHWRDLSLTTSELKKWWRLARTSLPGSEVVKLIDEVINPRQRTFVAAVLVIFVLNTSVAMALWNWQSLLSSVLSSAVK
jgi:hypothetical protein